MTHDNPYDQRESDWAAEDLRQRRADEADEAFNERRKLNKPKRDLVLPLKREYFDAIKAGEKVEEYRLCNEYWSKRLEGKTFDRVILTLGYPKRNDMARRIVRPYRGYVVKTISHSIFGVGTAQVFAINVAPDDLTNNETRGE